MDPTSKDWCPYKDKEMWRDPETHRKKDNEQQGSVQKDAGISQGMLKIAGILQKLEEAGRVLPRASREPVLLTLILDS